MKFRIVITNAIRIEAGPERFLAAIKQALTIPNPAQIQAERYGRGGWGIPPELTFYRQDGNALTVPRGFLPRLAAMPEWRDAAVEDKRLALPAIDIAFRALLRDYQDTAVKAMLSRDHGVLQAGTGAGKTVMALAIIAARKQPCLVLVHNKELLDQWADRARQFLGVEAGRIGGGKFEVRPLTIGIVNTVRHHLDDLPPHFGHVVVDECHRCPSAMFTECVDSFPAKYRLGLSATPYRRDGLTTAIGFFIGPKVHEVDQARLQLVGAILQPEVLTRKTAFRFARDGAEHYQEMLTALAQDQPRNALIAMDVKRELARDAGTVLVVSDRVAHLEALAACLNAAGVDMATHRSDAQSPARGPCGPNPRGPRAGAGEHCPAHWRGLRRAGAGLPVPGHADQVPGPLAPGGGADTAAPGRQNPAPVRLPRPRGRAPGIGQDAGLRVRAARLHPPRRNHDPGRDGMTLNLVLPITPKAQARPRFTKTGHAYKARAQRLAEEGLCALLAQHRPETPLDGALAMTATAFLPIPRSWSRKKQAAAREGALQPTGKPDLDNLVKHLKDCLTATRFWKDDALITEYTAMSKRYDDGNGPRWEVSITATEQTGK